MKRLLVLIAVSQQHADADEDRKLSGHVQSPRIRFKHVAQQWRRQGEGGKLPPYGWTSKNYVICACFHCHGTSSYHTTNTLQGRRATSHVDTQTIQPGLGDFVL